MEKDEQSRGPTHMLEAQNKELPFRITYGIAIFSWGFFVEYGSEWIWWR